MLGKGEGDEMLQYMLDEKIIETRVNRDTKEQEFAITHMGVIIMQMLKFFNGEVDEEDLDEKSGHELTR
tara:strand:- start:405 stop:611 length:207 start_codon:yes stop_codon:yes gene_type:complete